jgi:hypothetical protein
MAVETILTTTFYDFKYTAIVWIGDFPRSRCN